MKHLITILIMGSLTSFQSTFKNVEGFDVRIQIGPNMPGSEYDNLTCKGLVIETNREESPFDPIKAKRAIMRFRNTGIYNISLFSSGEDNKYPVRISYRDNNPLTRYIFEGFLIMDDNKEVYVPPGGTFILTATDNIALLKEKELTTDEEELVKGKFTFIQFVVWCLNKTGLPREIVVVDNLYETRHENRDHEIEAGPWHQTYIEALTFEKAVNERQDCYTVLKTILQSRKARLSYYKSKWWIVRIDEYKGENFSWTQYDNAGEIDLGLMDQPLGKVIGHASNESIYFVSENTEVKLRRPYKFARLKYNFKYPQELICNINWERGEPNYELGNTEWAAYNIECWTLKKAWPDDMAPNGHAYTRRIYNEDTYLIDQYIVMTPREDDILEHFESEPQYLGLKDKFTFSVDRCLNNTHGGSEQSLEGIAIIRLEGDDGSHWTMDDDGTWVQSNEAWFTNIKMLQWPYIPDSDDQREWKTHTWDSKALPVAGNVIIMLLGSPTQGVTDETRWNNLKFEYKPFIQGTYQRFNGETYKISRTGNYSAFHDEEMFIADAPKKLFKGAMFLNDPVDNKDAILTEKWYDWQLQHEAKEGIGNDRILKWLTFDVWNQFRGHLTNPPTLTPYGARIFEASLKGLQQADGEHCDLIHKYTNTVGSDHNRNKSFILGHFSQDWHTCKWSAIMIEVDDTRDSRKFDDIFEHKFIN